MTSPAGNTVKSQTPSGMPNRALTVSRLIAARSMRAWLRQMMTRVTLDPMRAMIGVALRMPRRH